jgi:hypothetical protein
VVLTGRFVKQEAYVADIGVSLSRSGSVIASRNEAQEEAASRRDGGTTFFLCGPPSGVCTTKLLTTKLQQYTSALLADENVAIRVRKKVAATTPVTEPVASTPATTVGTSLGTPGADASGVIGEESRRRRTLGWALVIGGGVLIGASIALWAVDETGTDCHGVEGDVDGCRKQLRTLPLAIGTGMAGVVAGAAGLGILMWGKGQNQMSVSLKGNGLSLGGKF